MITFAQQHIHFCFLSDASTAQACVTPEELKLLGEHRHGSRLEEFMLGRGAARLALRDARLPEGSPLLAGPQGEPLWPPGICGSISHSREYINGKRSEHRVGAAAVCSIKNHRSLGLDLEDLRRPMDPTVARKLCRNDELQLLNTAIQPAPTRHELPSGTPVSDAPRFNSLSSPERLLFILCVKEALYKALHPLCGIFFDFQDAELKPGEKTEADQVQLLKDLPGAAKSGDRFLINTARIGAFLLVWISVPPHVGERS